jgi:hypothetical protein
VECDSQPEPGQLRRRREYERVIGEVRSQPTREERAITVHTEAIKADRLSVVDNFSASHA